MHGFVTLISRDRSHIPKKLLTLKLRLISAHVFALSGIRPLPIGLYNHYLHLNCSKLDFKLIFLTARSELDLYFTELVSLLFS